MPEVRLGDMRLHTIEKVVQRDNEIPDQPVQEGKDLSDDVNTKPRIFDLRVVFAEDTEEQTRAKLARLKQLRQSKEPVRFTSPEDVVPEAVVLSMQDTRGRKRKYDVRLKIQEIIRTDAGNSEESRNGAEGVEEATKDGGQRPDQSEEEDDQNLLEILGSNIFSEGTISGGGL